jgi:aminoglycoside phosphotransferase (APT) family kinase protein
MSATLCPRTTVPSRWKAVDRALVVGWAVGVTERLHEDELDVDEDLVRRLLGTLSTAYAALPLRRFASSGSDNALFRLGTDLLVRVPRQPGGTSTIEKEQRWVPYVAPALPVGVPEIVAVGEPGFGYPEKWSVVRFLEGTAPSIPAPGEPPRHELARDLAAVVQALRDLPVTEEALADPGLRWYRGEPLAGMDAEMGRLLAGCRALEDLDLDVDAVERVWKEVMRVPGIDRAMGPLWHHADLVAENLLTRDGRLTAVLDLGGLAIGDPTVDLMVAWELLDPEARATFREALGTDDATWMRGRGWALALAVMTFPYYWVGRCRNDARTGSPWPTPCWPRQPERDHSAVVHQDQQGQQHHEQRHHRQSPAVEPEAVGPEVHRAGLVAGPAGAPDLHAQGDAIGDVPQREQHDSASQPHGASIARVSTTPRCAPRRWSSGQRRCRIETPLRAAR